jgi:hypothetical protein
MGIAYVNGQVTALAVRAVLLLILSLGGCASSSSPLMDARAEAPSPQQKYLPVEDLPPKREKPAMTAVEQAKLKKELTPRATARRHPLKPKEALRLLNP